MNSASDAELRDRYNICPTLKSCDECNLVFRGKCKALPLSMTPECFDTVDEFIRFYRDSQSTEFKLITINDLSHIITSLCIHKNISYGKLMEYVRNEITEKDLSKIDNYNLLITIKYLNEKGVFDG